MQKRKRYIYTHNLLFEIYPINFAIKKREREDGVDDTIKDKLNRGKSLEKQERKRKREKKNELEIEKII